MRIPVVLKRNRRYKDGLIYSVGNVSINANEKETVINIIPMYISDKTNNRGGVFPFITIPKHIKKDDVTASLTTDMGCSVMTTSIKNVCEIECNYYTAIDKIIVVYTDVHTGEKHRLIMQMVFGDCVITRDKTSYSYDEEAKDWAPISK